MKRFAFITDIHLDEQFTIDNNVHSKSNFEIVLADIERRKINEVIFGGDIGEALSHKYFFEKLQRFSLKLILGNHDTYDKVKLHFKNGIGKNELFYANEDENYQYIFLDTSIDILSSLQLEWFKNTLNDNKKLLLFIHHPILQVDTAVDKLYPLKNRDEIKSILLNFKNSVSIFCGHYHMNDEQLFKNIKQYITISMAFQIVKNATEIKIDNKVFGYRIIEINNDNIESEVINFEQ